MDKIQNKLQIKDNIQPGVTIITNNFIDKYLCAADGEFVKVYILLLRLINGGIYQGPEQIADLLNLMQRDVDRALKYWEKNGLITLPSTEPVPQETVTDKQPVSSSVESKAKGPSDHISETSGLHTSLRQAPQKSSITPSDLNKAMSGNDFSQTCFMAETYIGHPLSHSEVSVFYYIENQLGFSSDLLEYLIEYCVTRGKKSVRYMETVAIAWFEQHIDTVQKAKEQSDSYKQNVFSIMKAFGISNRNPGTSEMEYIQKWNAMGFSTDIIVEACNRTMLAIHQASFPYASRILEKWKSQGVKTMKDIQALDDDFHAEKPAVAVSVSASSNQKKPTGNAFHDFEHRSTYDFDDLEARLRGIKNTPTE